MNLNYVTLPMTRRGTPRLYYQSYVIWRGASPVNGKDILAVLCCGQVRNTKTGPMLGLWVLPGELMDDPSLNMDDILKLGLDKSCCHTCPFRSRAAGGTGGCYTHGHTVNMGGQKMVEKLRRENWPALSPWDTLELVAAWTDRGRKLRLGVFGDPGLLPQEVVHTLSLTVGFQDNGQPNWSGYTHVWRELPAQPWAEILMASVETKEDAAYARSLGWRTFRVRAGLGDTDTNSEFSCPASTEMGYKTNCSRCLGCAGTSSLMSKSVVINAHNAPSRIKRSYQALGVFSVN